MLHENLLWHFAGKNSKSLHLAFMQDQPSGGNIPRLILAEWEWKELKWSISRITKHEEVL
jgi:hypothetical protein